MIFKRIGPFLSLIKIFDLVEKAALAFSLFHIRTTDCYRMLIMYTHLRKENSVFYDMFSYGKVFLSVARVYAYKKFPWQLFWGEGGGGGCSYYKILQTADQTHANA